MKILVQKFGGTSVSTHEARLEAISKVKEALKEGYRVVTVVSAMGRNGAPYATDTLINLARSTYAEIKEREMDILLNCGEIISSVVFNQELQGAGIDGAVLTGAQAGILTDDQHTEAKIIDIGTGRITSLLEQNKVVVVAGFQGVTTTGELTTLGRGGSDTTATALAAALNAELCEIYTDVDGIMTADPRIVKEAKTLDTISFQEARNLFNQGAKVVHPRAVEYAMRKNLPVRIKNTFTNHRGTLITDLSEKNESIWDFENPIMGITQMDGIVQITVKNNEMPQGTWEYQVFTILANADISVDFINVFMKEVVFTIKEKDVKKAVEILVDHSLSYEMIEDCAKISAVGTNMSEIPGVMAKLMETLSQAKIPVLQTADSNVTIWCLVSAKHMNKAVLALHEAFEL